MIASRWGTSLSRFLAHLVLRVKGLKFPNFWEGAYKDWVKQRKAARGLTLFFLGIYNGTPNYKEVYILQKHFRGRGRYMRVKYEPADAKEVLPCTKK